MRYAKLVRDNPNMFSFLCDCPGSGIVVLVHEIPDKASGEKPDVMNSQYYYAFRRAHAFKRAVAAVFGITARVERVHDRQYRLSFPKWDDAIRQYEEPFFRKCVKEQYAASR